MSAFICTICGEPKTEEEKVSSVARYCRHCSNDYQVTRRKVLQAGFAWSMAAYRKNRIRRGLPTSSQAKMGRPKKVLATFKACEICQMDFYTDVARTDYALLGRICANVCGRDYERHALAVRELTIEWYVALRTLIKGPTGDPILPMYAASQGRPSKNHLMTLEETYDAIRLTIKNYPDLQPLLELIRPQQVVQEIPPVVQCRYVKNTTCEHTFCRKAQAND